MKNRLKSNLPAQLARGRERFEKWRSKQKTRSRLPEPLWLAAVKLAQRYGVNRTARALRLDYNGLKKRMESTICDAPVQAGVKPGDNCPSCKEGTVYETATPGRLVRVTGQAPVNATVYELQKLRCNL